MRVLTANLGFPFTVPAGVLCASLQPRKRGCLGFPFGHCSCDWGWRHSFFYSLWPVWNDYWLKVSVLLGCPSLGSLARENRFWGWGFFSSMYFSLCISGMLAFQLHVWAGIHETRKSRELTTILVLESWGPWPLYFLSTFQRFLVYFIYISQGFWMYLAGRIAGRKAGVPLWWIIESDSFFTMYALRMAGVIYPKHYFQYLQYICSLCLYNLNIIYIILWKSLKGMILVVLFTDCYTDLSKD